MRRSASSLNHSEADFRPSFDSLLALKHRVTRDRDALYFVEGYRFAYAALAANAPIVAVAHCPELARPYSACGIADRLARYPQLRLTKEQMTALGFSPEPQGIVLILRQQLLGLSDIVPRGAATWLGIETFRRPGNLGTIFRSAGASGSPGMFLFGNRGEHQDVFDPLVMRASMGTHFDLKFVRSTYREFAHWEFRLEFRVLGADARGPLDYRKVGYRRPLLLMIGNERSGLSPGQRSCCDDLVRIPMARPIDSLNAAMAATILLFEAFGQRRNR